MLVNVITGLQSPSAFLVYLCIHLNVTMVKAGLLLLKQMSSNLYGLTLNIVQTHKNKQKNPNTNMIYFVCSYVFISSFTIWIFA